VLHSAQPRAALLLWLLEVNACVCCTAATEYTGLNECWMMKCCMVSFCLRHRPEYDMADTDAEAEAFMVRDLGSGLHPALLTALPPAHAMLGARAVSLAPPLAAQLPNHGSDHGHGPDGSPFPLLLASLTVLDEPLSPQSLPCTRDQIGGNWLGSRGSTNWPPSHAAGQAFSPGQEAAISQGAVYLFGKGGA
jgi:hypothetical protein